MDFAFNLLYYSTQKVETVKISSVFFCFFFWCATECLKECWTFVVPGTVLPVVSSMQVPTFMRSFPLCSSELGLLWSLKGWVPVSQISVPCAASALPVASLLALLAPPGSQKKGSLSLLPFATLPQAQLMNCISSVCEISAERKAWGWGECRVNCCTFIVWFLLVASWHPMSEGNLTKLSRQLILNLTDVICFLRGQESADLSLFWSPLRLNYKHGMWVGRMMNSPAGEGGTKSSNLVGLHLILRLTSLVPLS